MTTFTWDDEKLVLVISGSGTLECQQRNTSAIHIALTGFSKISDRCFSYYTELSSISLPESVTYLGNDFLINTKVTEIFLPKNVQYLHTSQAFDCYYYLGNITVDPSNPYFRDVNGVLYSKNMKELHFYPGNRPETTCIVPSGVEVIKVAAFSNSRYRKEIIIPPSVKKIERALGYQSIALEKVVILQCPRLVKLDDNLLFYGISKGKEIIHYEHTKCIIPKTCRQPKSRALSFNTIFIAFILCY